MEDGATVNALLITLKMILLFIAAYTSFLLIARMVYKKNLSVKYFFYPSFSITCLVAIQFWLKL